VSVVIAIGEKQPKSPEKIDTDADAVYRHNFGRLEIGKHYGKDQLAGTEAVQTISDFPWPMISALVTESENPSIALRALEPPSNRISPTSPRPSRKLSPATLTDESGQRCRPGDAPDGGNPEGERGG